MATKQELLNAMKVIKEHCKTIQLMPEEYLSISCCDKCPIGEICEGYFNPDVLPEDWDIEGGGNCE